MPEEAVLPLGAGKRAERAIGTNQGETHVVSGAGLFEQALSRDNLIAALKRVKANGGAPGIDGMTTKELEAYLKTSWLSIKQALLAGTYRPQPVRRVEIPKPGGGVRLLGIPTVLDRFIQQAIAQALTPIFDPMFSASSHGFRPGRKAHDAVMQAQTYIQAGFTWVVDLDLEKFFDRVNHDVLMARVARRVGDKRVLRLIRRYLESGIMTNGVCVKSEEGTPQGGPLSPLLANILLDDLDKELERRGHRFTRYADDCNIFVRSERSGQRVMQSVTTYLERVLRLKVNHEKSAVDRPWKRKFLGFSFYRKEGITRVRMAPQTLKRFKTRARQLTCRRKPLSIEQRIEGLNQYLRGWLGYFALADGRSSCTSLDQWIRRRMRMCQWKQWKRTAARRRNLRKLGLSEDAINIIVSSRKGYWRVAGTPQLHQAMNVAYWRNLGLLSLEHRYLELRSIS